MAGMKICSGGLVDAGDAPEEIKILPLGHVHTSKGDFEVDDESVRMILEKFKERGNDLVIDYEHQSLKGTQAPAGGWIRDIYKGEDALVAKVEWTDKAREYLKNKEYRYLSPVVLVLRDSNRAAWIHSVALTNVPSISKMFAMVNSAGIEIAELEETEGNYMELKELVKILGLPETATEEDVRKALSAAGEKKEEPAKEDAEPAANAVVLSLLGLKADAKTEDVAAAVMELKAGTGKEEMLALRAELEKRDAEAAVTAALKAGKITASQKEWALGYALSDKAGFEAFAEKAPVVVPQGKLELKDAPKDAAKDYDMKILKNCGISKEDIEKYYREDE